MDIAIMVIPIALAVFFTVGGLLKLVLSYGRFSKMPFQEWAIDFKPEHIRLIGVLELGAAVGMVGSLIVPALNVLMPFVATGMALVMAGAMATHLRRSEYVNMFGNFVWLGLAAFLAYGTLVGFAA